MAREFVGRQDELKTLHQKLQGSDQVAIAALAGMGGIGKTALAQQYVRQAKDEYPGGRWYFKLREQNLATLLVGAAALFDWQLPDTLSDDGARVKWCYDQWCHHFPGTRLLLLDDVQTYQDVKHFLPIDNPSFRVLMTSRQRFDKPVDRLDLGELPLPEAIELLTALMGDRERVTAQQTEAEALCEWVERLPLGVELIARYLAVHGNLRFSKLLERLELQKLAARAMRDLPEEMAYEYSIEAAFELSWQDLTPEAKTLMGVLSIFAAAPIPKGLIEGALSKWDEEDLEEGLDAGLVKRNLLQRDKDGSYQLHQLIREFTVGKLETELGEQTSALQKGVAVAVTNFASTIEPIVRKDDRQAVGLGVPHMALVAQELNDILADDEDPGWVFTGLARFYESQSLWPEAERWYKGRLKMSERRFDSDHPDTATSLNNLALLYDSMGRYTDAEPLYARSLEIREAQLGPDHPDTATSLNNLAELYRSMGRYTDAEPLFARSLEIREAQLGPNHPDTASSLNNLAGLYRSMGHYTDAEPLYARSLEIREAQLGPDHPDTAGSYNNMATFFYALERYAESANFGVKALEVFLTKLGQDHPNTQTVGNNFVTILQKVIETNQTEQLSDHPLTQRA
ncbi:tetratricopeptide repeat protein [Leptothoe sp. PORK10 BA2]|uniref:tetratricopeptide repeat protein n=1 Tax=Leptothoe sp. PORK10 BA2 TaxID=3110254 RepID=UPI002B203E1C|nr:tetratricopeptide repeat protein [Leptothoe sp. PORK10 BA2]MEA5466463.1 tetratricopeptide repeat protein [Leptothoe sp. PORK10 BA2]